MNTRVLPFFLVMGLPVCLAAQSTVAPTSLPAAPAEPTPAARLEQLDATYSANLRKYHSPVILDYLRELETLRQTLASQGHDKDAAQVQTEIEKTKKLSTTTGLLSYDPLKPPPDPQTAPPPDRGPGGKAGRRMSADAINLPIANAVNASPAAESVRPRPDAAALPLGHAEWRVEKVPAGVYEVMLVSAMIENMEKTSVQATLGPYTAERKTPPRAAGSANDFRVFRVGTFSLDQDMANVTLTLESSDPTKPCMWVRNVLLTHPKTPPPGNKPPGPGGPGGPGGPPPGGKPPGDAPPPPK